MRVTAVLLALCVTASAADDPGTVVLNDDQKAFCALEGGCRMLTNIALMAMVQAAWVAGYQARVSMCWRDA